jgi:hypothetical protein
MALRLLAFLDESHDGLFTIAQINHEAKNVEFGRFSRKDAKEEIGTKYITTKDTKLSAVNVP